MTLGYHEPPNQEWFSPLTFCYIKFSKFPPLTEIKPIASCIPAHAPSCEWLIYRYSEISLECAVVFQSTDLPYNSGPSNKAPYKFTTHKINSNIEHFVFQIVATWFPEREPATRDHNALSIRTETSDKFESWISSYSSSSFPLSDDDDLDCGILVGVDTFISADGGCGLRFLKSIWQLDTE